MKIRVRAPVLALPVFFWTLVWLVLLAIHGRVGQFGHYSSRFAYVLLFVLSICASGYFFASKSHQKTVLSFTSGLIVYYYLLFGLGILHFYHPYLLLVLFFLPGVVLLTRIKLTQLNSVWKKTFEFTWQELSLVFVLLSLLFYSFLVSLNPVIHYDALTNHLDIPAEYLSRWGMEPIPYNLHANLPPASHMIHLILIACAGGDTVQLFHFFVILFLFLAARQLIPSTVAWLCACIIFLLIPQVSLLFSLTNIDYLTTLFCVVALILARECQGGYRMPVLLGMHLAFLLSLKYQSVFFVILVVLYLLFRKRYRDVAVAAVLACLLITPFLIKNYVYVKNPVFPFLSQIFPSPDITRQEITGFIRANQLQADGWHVVNYIKTVVLCLTKQPETGLLFFIIVISAICIAKLRFPDKNWIVVLFIFPVLFLALITFNVANTIRWIQPSWFFLSILGGASIAYLLEKKPFIIIFFAGWIVISFYLAFQFNYYLTRSIAVVTGEVSEEQYRSMFIPSYHLRMALPRLAGTVLFIGDSRGFYNVENSIIPAAYNYLYIKKYFDGARDAEDLRMKFKKGNVQFLFINITEVFRNIQKGRYLWMKGANLDLLRDLEKKSTVLGRDDDSIVIRL